MPITFTCPHCGRQTEVADEHAGQAGPCAACGKPVTVPPAGMPLPTPLGRKKLIGWIIALIVVLPLAAYVGLFVPAIPASREPARRAHCSNNLKQIAIALQNYHDTFGCFPPACRTDEYGRPTHSWRVLAMCYLESTDILRQCSFAMDEPWDSPANQRVRDLKPPVFLCPSDAEARPGETSYVMVVGPGLFGDGEKPTRLSDVTDGPADTIMIVELHHSGIEWTEPRDATADDILALLDRPGHPGAETSHPGGFQVAFCNGSVKLIPKTIDEATLRALLTRASGEKVEAY